MMRILVTDDDPISRMALTDVLGQIPDVEITEAQSGEAAWTLLCGGLYPVLCCFDVHMDAMTGIDLLRRMRSTAHMAKIPVLMVTSASDRETVTQALKGGANGFILKPFQAMEVRAKMETALGNAVAGFFEDTALVSKRMGVAPSQYAVYLYALAAQIDAAVVKAKSGALLDKAALAPLKAGCTALGAHYCATALDAAEKSLVNGPLSAATIEGIAALPVILRQRYALVRSK